MDEFDEMLRELGADIDRDLSMASTKIMNDILDDCLDETTKRKEFQKFCKDENFWIAQTIQ